MAYEENAAGLSRRQLMTLIGAGTGATAFSQFAAGARPAAMPIALLNGNIITQDPLRPRVSALMLRDGLVAATGSDGDIQSMIDNGTHVIDLKGKTVIPGLNDSHQHPTRAGRFYATELRWDGLDSLETGLKMIREQAARTPKGQWVRVIGGWSPYQFKEQRMPTPGELTEASPDVPVYVLFLYSQGFLNKAAVEARGLTPGMSTPPGTAYRFTPDGGAIIDAIPNPDLLYGTIGALPPMSVEDQVVSSQHYYRELNRHGLTSVIDAGGGGHRFPEDYSGSLALAESNNLALRISKYLFPQKKGAELSEFRRWTAGWQIHQNRAHSLMHGYIVRGGGEFLAWSAGDYENFLAPRPDITTRPTWRKDLLGVTRHLLKNRWPLRIHATYDESINHILDVFEEAHALEVSEKRLGFGGIRFVIDHGETLQRPTMARLKVLGAGMAMQSRMAYAGEYFLERYGEEATRRAPPLRDVVAAGIPLGLGSDATRVSSYNPWATLYWATTGRSIGGTLLHGPEQQLSREQALFHHTVGSAWVSQEERFKGRLRAGQFADLAVLNAPYLDVADEDLRHIESDLTVVGGKPVFSSGEFDVDVPELPMIRPDWSPVHQFGGYQHTG